MRTLALDLSDQAQRDRLVREAPDIDVLVNNAGAIPGGNIFDVDDKAWRTGWELKVFGYVNLTRAYFALMKEKKRGVIINICGAGGETLSFGYIAGAAGNASLMAFSRAMGGTSLDWGVRVLAVNPGPVETDRVVYLAKQRAASHGDESRWREDFKRMPYGRPADVDEIAPMVVFLASDLVALYQRHRRHHRRRAAAPPLRSCHALRHDTRTIVRLHYEVAGSGAPIVFVHELAGTWHSFEPQIEALKGRFRCIAYNARGYPPSDVPPSVNSYSQDLAAADIGAVMDAAHVASAHVMGVSMGSAAALQFALKQPQRARRVILCSIGSGSDAKPGEYMKEMEARARSVEAGGMAKAAENFAQLAEPPQTQGQEPGASRALSRGGVGAFGQGHHQHHARRAAAPPAALCAQGRDRRAQGAGAGRGRRRRRGLPQAEPLPGRHAAGRAARSDRQYRPRAQSRGARRSSTT